jgi:hypothetical protein
MGSFREVKFCRSLRLTIWPPSVNRFFRQCGLHNISQPYRHPWPATGIALLFWYLSPYITEHTLFRSWCITSKYEYVFLFCRSRQTCFFANEMTKFPKRLHQNEPVIKSDVWLRWQKGRGKWGGSEKSAAVWQFGDCYLLQLSGSSGIVISFAISTLSFLSNIYRWLFSVGEGVSAVRGAFVFV